MTRRVWTWTIATAILSVAAWIAGAGASAAPRLRSEHSAPATRAPATVAVTSNGKLFHRAECTYIHGPLQMISGEQAISEGFTPCTRCLPR
jgi:hypothetical protein